jgi:Holliday junction resolvase
LKPESKFWKEWKAFTPNILWTRLENMSSLGTPDLLGYNKNKTFFTVELKVTTGNSVRLSPHQMSFHIRHPENTFILVKSLASSISKLDDKKLDNVKLYEGKNIKELAARGLQLAAHCEGLDACRLHLESL